MEHTVALNKTLLNNFVLEPYNKQLMTLQTHFTYIELWELTLAAVLPSCYQSANCDHTM